MLRQLLTAAFLACQLSQASAQTLLDKARRDDVASVRSGDPALAAAMQRARAGLDEFLAIAAAPHTETRDFSLKVRLPVSEDSNEYIWIRPFTSAGGKFLGTVVSNPRHFSNLAHGDRLAFENRDIVDWSYVKHDRVKGNYTACALAEKEPAQQREAFKRRYQLDCTD